MRMMTGFIAPTSGHAFIDDLDVALHPVEARRRFGYLPENAPLYQEMTVEGFLSFCAETRGLVKRNLTSDELREAVKSSKEDAHIMDGILQESMVKYAHLIRDSIDAVNPSIPCSFCLCSQDVRHAPAVAKILAGHTGEAVIRINNARYLQDSLRNIPAWLHFTATQIATFNDDVTLICEPDTFPQNRYSTSAATLRMHVTMSALEGCKGGKYWITRMSSFEPNSGKAYRKALAEISNQLESIYAMKLQWQGICIPMPSTPV